MAKTRQHSQAARRAQTQRPVKEPVRAEVVRLRRLFCTLLCGLALLAAERAARARATGPRAALLVGSHGPLRPRPGRASRPVVPVLPAIELEHLTTHATHRLRPDLRGQRFSSRQMKVLSSLLRCHHTGKRHAMSERLIEILYATARHYHNAKLLIVAGYRAPAIARQKGNPKSAHKRGVACDFRVVGASVESVRDYLRKTFHNVGIGYYPNAEFVHVDVGRTRDAFWVDYSAPGQKAKYGPLREPGSGGSDDEEPSAVASRGVPAAPDLEKSARGDDESGDEAGDRTGDAAGIGEEAGAKSEKAGSAPERPAPERPTALKKAAASRPAASSKSTRRTR